MKLWLNNSDFRVSLSLRGHEDHRHSREDGDDYDMIVRTNRSDRLATLCLKGTRCVQGIYSIHTRYIQRDKGIRAGDRHHRPISLAVRLNRFGHTSPEMTKFGYHRHHHASCLTPRCGLAGGC